MSLETLESEVELLLCEFEKTRADDMALYAMYLNKHEVDLVRVFNNRGYRIMKGISTFESVSRCRRKLQEKYPELKPSEESLAIRKEQEKVFKEYAREH